MFAFQAYAQKPREDEEQEASGAKAKKKQLEETKSLDALPEQISIARSDIDKVFRKAGVSEFLTTLTPGAQNAIYAASFAWGYENAAKYVKNSMKLEEVKNAAGAEEKSKAVVESVQSQAQSEQPEPVKETSKFVWGFYNEDLKETQAQASKTEHITGRQKTATQELVIPATAPVAVASSIAENSNDPCLLYCSSAQQVVEEQRQQQLSAEKKQELAKLVTAPRARVPSSKSIQAQKAEAEAEAASLALERREEVLAEYQEAEKKLNEAIKVLDQFETDSREDMKKVAAMLPKELSKVVLRRGTLLAKRKALRAQLVKWVAFSRDSRQSLLSMPPSRLLKLVSLSSLLKLGK